MNPPEIVVHPEPQRYNTPPGRLYRATLVNGPGYFLEYGTTEEEALQKLEDSMVEHYRAMAALVAPIFRKRTAWKEGTP